MFCLDESTMEKHCQLKIHNTNFTVTASQHLAQDNGRSLCRPSVITEQADTCSRCQVASVKWRRNPTSFQPTAGCDAPRDSVLSPHGIRGSRFELRIASLCTHEKQKHTVDRAKAVGRRHHYIHRTNGHPVLAAGRRNFRSTNEHQGCRATARVRT